MKKSFLLAAFMAFAILTISTLFISCEKETINSLKDGNSPEMDIETSTEQNNKNTFIEENTLNLVDMDTYVIENYAFVGLSVRSIDQINYVREFSIIDIVSEDYVLLGGLSFMDSIFVDNGEGYDLIAGDGIYTSKYSFTHNEVVPYNPNLESVLINNNAFVTSAFDGNIDDINRILGAKGGGKGFPSVEVEADICFCSCDACSCYGCDWFGGPGCWYLCDDTLHFKFTW